MYICIYICICVYIHTYHIYVYMYELVPRHLVLAEEEKRTLLRRYHLQVRCHPGDNPGANRWFL